jgi:hypothetical protein
LQTSPPIANGRALRKDFAGKTVGLKRLVGRAVGARTREIPCREHLEETVVTEINMSVKTLDKG